MLVEGKHCWEGTMSKKPWHHAPPHIFVPCHRYMISAGTLHKVHLFTSPSKLAMLEKILLDVLTEYMWDIRAWSVFSNHYHFVGISPENVERMSMMLNKIHGCSAREVNMLDNAEGRRVWFENWDTCLNNEREYLSHLNYVHHNAVHHGLVKDPCEYPYCSAKRFYGEPDELFRRKVLDAKYGHGEIEDDF
jgi:putative transposase